MNAPQPPPYSATPANYSRPLKIALLGYRSDPHVGGQGVYLYYLSRALLQMGHEVHVYSGPPYPNLVKGIKLITVPSLDLYASVNHVKALRWKHLRSFTDSWEWFSMLTGGFPEPYTFGRRVVRKLTQQHYDIVHDNQSLCFGLLKLQQLGWPVVSTIHHPIHRDLEQALNSASTWHHRLLIRRWYSFLTMQEKVVKQLRHVVTVSRQSQKDIKKFFLRDHSRTHLITNGVDIDVFKPLNNIKRHSAQLITTASAEQPVKGLGVLLNTLARLKRDHPRIRLIIIGKLKADGAAQRQIHRLGLLDNIRCYSGISTRRLVELYAESTIAVVPSLYEGFGLPLAEAMSCGLPVVSSDGGALPEVLGDAGILCPAGDIAAMTQAITRLLMDSQQRQRLAQLSRQRVKNKFCWHKVAQQLTSYYWQMLELHVNY